MRALLAALAGVLLGCGSIDLPDEFRPLRHVVEGHPLGGTNVTTVGGYVVVSDLERYEDLGDPVVRAVLLHERVHAIRQGRFPPFWIARYLASREFAWAEEQRGWYEQIQSLRRQGQGVNAEWIAGVLSDYWHPMGKLVSYADALAWVQDVLSGRWAPKGD